MRTTKIEWAQATWNPWVGCSITSPGCTNCYAMKMAPRLASFAKSSAYRGTFDMTKAGAVWNGKLGQSSAATRMKPRNTNPGTVFFVNSMSDFFHGAAPDEWRNEALYTMKRCPQHIFQILTKRPEIAVEYTERWRVTWPANVWLGVSIESQPYVHRLDTLTSIKCAVRFVSAEPLLGPVELDTSHLDWIIIGGESGPRARKVEASWAYDLIDQCRGAGVPTFFKQWGKEEFNPAADDPERALHPYDAEAKGGCLVRGIVVREMPPVWHQHQEGR